MWMNTAQPSQGDWENKRVQKYLSINPNYIINLCSGKVDDNPYISLFGGNVKVYNYDMEFLGQAKTKIQGKNGATNVSIEYNVMKQENERQVIDKVNKIIATHPKAKIMIVEGVGNNFNGSFDDMFASPDVHFVGEGRFLTNNVEHTFTTLYEAHKHNPNVHYMHSCSCCRTFPHNKLSKSYKQEVKSFASNQDTGLISERQHNLYKQESIGVPTKNFIGENPVIVESQRKSSFFTQCFKPQESQNFVGKAGSTSALQGTKEKQALKSVLEEGKKTQDLASRRDAEQVSSSSVYQG
jgi:hypothetical protein